MALFLDRTLFAESCEFTSDVNTWGIQLDVTGN
jgi:hypothetical protein